MIAHYFRIACQQLEKYKLQTLLSLVGLAIGFTCFVLFIHFIHPKGMDDTYWRDEVTGDWFIGFTPESVIYADKFWDIVSQTEEEDSYQLVVSDGTVTLPIKVGAMSKPLSSKMMKLVEDEIALPFARKKVLDLNDHYLTIQKRDISKSASLKSFDAVNEMSDGEKILRKLIEPYKGKIILLDIWGTWCGPCKAALSYSQEEYERLEPYDMMFLYLANGSSDKSWKNIIKEYNVTGDNVVHYNLPDEQQSAVEHFLKVSAFPTYKLIDEEGNILDVDADPYDLNRLEKLVKLMKGYN